MDPEDPSFLMHRVDELFAQGKSRTIAFAQSNLEWRIAWWQRRPESTLPFIIFGEIMLRCGAVNIPELGITIEPDRLSGEGLPADSLAYRADISVFEKSIPGLIDAIRRINLFLGATVLADWGNARVQWWSFVSHGPGGGSLMDFDSGVLCSAVSSILRLRPDVQKKIEAALFWIRDRPSGILQWQQPDSLRTFAGYWNAFECLVDAVLLLFPLRKLSSTEKQESLDNLLRINDGRLTPRDIVEYYQSVLNPGLVGRARHVFEVCFPEDSERYLFECFKKKPASERLYDIRNAINHGSIDAENPHELARVDDRLSVLWKIVWRLFGRFLDFPCPKDSATGA